MYTYTIYIYIHKTWVAEIRKTPKDASDCVCVSMQCCKCSFLTSFPWMCPNMQPDWIC